MKRRHPGYGKVRMAALQDHARRIRSATETAEHYIDNRDRDIASWYQDGSLTIGQIAKATCLTPLEVKFIICKDRQGRGPKPYHE